MTKFIVGSVGAAILGFFGIVVLAVVMFSMAGYGKYKDFKLGELRYEAKLKDNSSEFDNMKKTISQVAQVTDAQMEKLKEIYVSNAEARTEKSDQLLFKFVKEVAPNIDQSTYKELINTIKGSRSDWTMRQKELVQMATSTNEILVDPFWGWVMTKFFGLKMIDAKVITSSDTEKAFQTGKDDDTSLFKK